MGSRIRTASRRPVSDSPWRGWRCRAGTIGDGGGFETEVESGIDDLCLLKTTGSGFENYRRDDLTTLPPTTDRILSTLLTGRWAYVRPLASAAAYEAANAAVREAMLGVFAREYSVSVQATLYTPWARRR